MHPVADMEDFPHYIWRRKYRGRNEATLAQTWQRVATAAAAVERDPADWQARFLALLEDFRFLPGGRILAGAGTGLNTTLFNCFVMGLIPDDMEGIFNSLREGALTMQAGGGVGYDFSTLRPQGTPAKATGNIASGPVSFMHIWNAMCATLLSTGARRGAMIASLRCEHPDIELFIDAKRNGTVLNHFNLSVQVTDAFMCAVAEQRDWPLLFPLQEGEQTGGRELVLHAFTGREGKVPCVVYKRVQAAQLWQKIMQANYVSGEPGVLFTDRINAQNNLRWREQLSCTNPCGEIPLPPYGACNLGSLNLSRFVRQPFTPAATLDLQALDASATLATRFLDNIIDCSRFPLAAQAQAATGSRRIGLGITGLGDALLMLGLHYGSAAARKLAANCMQTICHAAYRSSVRLAEEKGCFPFYERQPYLHSAFVQALPVDIRDGIALHGIRNSHLLAIAPAGTISLLAGNVSSGIEPVFAFVQQRSVLETDGSTREFRLEDHAWHRWRETAGANAEYPACFVTAQELAPREHLLMQAALQPFVDNAISKTINVPERLPFSEFADLYREAHALGLKGCTTFRSGSRDTAILKAVQTELRSVEDCARCDTE
jgi:ribonucleoside-diphosphate reductase alpha chain